MKIGKLHIFKEYEEFLEDIYQIIIEDIQPIIFYYVPGEWIVYATSKIFIDAEEDEIPDYYIEILKIKEGKHKIIIWSDYSEKQ